MASITPFIKHLKPAVDDFLKNSTLDRLERLKKKLYAFNWIEGKIVHVHLLLPLILKLEELNGKNLELRTGLLECISLVLSHVYINEVKGLSTILAIVLKQVRNLEKANTLPNLSEEIKLAAVHCISEALIHSTSDVLESFYNTKSSTLLGHVLLFLVELIELEKYRKLKLAAIECLLVVFYVHDKTNTRDVVLRSQVADSLFIYLPKVIAVLFKISTSDDKLGETLKENAIKALGRILHLIYEDTNEYDYLEKNFNSKDFQKLLEPLKSESNGNHENIIFEGSKMKKDKLEEQLTKLQNKGRSSQWFKETSRRINGLFSQMVFLRSHTSIKIRLEYAKMCCTLIENCTQNLKGNFLILLENLIALSEDENEEISKICTDTLKKLQLHTPKTSIFIESADLLFEQHGTKLVQILQRKDESELYAELLFLKGFLRNVDSNKLFSLFSLQTFLENFCMSLITAVDMESTFDFLNEEYALRKLYEFENENETETGYTKLKWRYFKYLESERCIFQLENICALLGQMKQINCLLYDYLLESFQTEKQTRMNEILLILIWIFAPNNKISQPLKKRKISSTKFVDKILEQLLNDIHWNLALHPDEVSHLKIDKPSYWLVERTPGLYESAYEVRIQDFDSDDEEIQEIEENRVTVYDAQQNVLHTCIVLDALGHIAKYLGISFKKHTFQSLHKVLLKVASSNTMVYKAGMFALFSIQSSLGYDSTTKFIENHTDYISYHLNMLLRRTPDSSSAVDILSVVLQLSSQRTLPHLESIFETIREECSKKNQVKNITAYLRVFNAFLVNVKRWKISTEMEIDENLLQNLEIEKSASLNSESLLHNWLEILEKDTKEIDENKMDENKTDESTTIDEETANESLTNENCDKKTSTTKLPRHIEIAKQILQQVLKFISNSNQIQQIQALECLIVGVPLLKDYEDDLLPLVHTIWQPLVEKFRQKDPLVLNRCFTLLNILSTHAKDFILKRSLDDVIPYLKVFLKDSAAESALEHSKAQTQLYKLQLKLLQEFSNLIITMQIDGKHLNDISEVIILYMSQKQPKELQTSSIECFLNLRYYNSPLIYLILTKKLHLKEYERNVKEILLKFGL